MKKYLAISIASILALSAPGIAKAQFTVTAAIGGVPTVSGATLENFDEPSPSILTLSGAAYLVTGAVPAHYAPPYFSGSTAAFFGESPTVGPDSSQYVAVEVGGSATLSFSTPQNYLGLLWGSIDASNSLTFYDSANNVIGTVLGTDVPGVQADGDQGPNGSPYVNITSAIPFSSVVATSRIYPFEFDDVAYAQADPLLITPATNFTACGGVGGPFTITNQSFTLTNTGTNSLDWCLAIDWSPTNISGWLDASPTGGTLPGGAATNVTVCLNFNAYSLPTGIYTATVWFTNLNSGIGQSRQFTLTVIGPPVITCPSNITVTGCLVVNYPAPTVSGGCPPITVNCVPPSGSMFPIGTTTVNCCATDACGRSNCCSFTVTVSSPPPPVMNVVTTVNNPVPAAYGPPTVWPYTAGGLSIPTDASGYTDQLFGGSTNVLGETFQPTRDFMLRNFYIACSGTTNSGNYALLLYDLGTGSAPASFNPSIYTNLLAHPDSCGAMSYWSFSPNGLTNKTIVKFKLTNSIDQVYMTNGHTYFLGFQYIGAFTDTNSVSYTNNDMCWERTTSSQTYANGTAYEGNTTSVANGFGGGNRNFIMAIDVLNPNPVISVANVALSTNWPASPGVPAIETFADPQNMDDSNGGESRSLINGATISMSFIAPSNFNLGSIVLRQNGIGSSNVLFTVGIWDITNTFFTAADSVQHWPFNFQPNIDTSPKGIPVFGTNVDFYYTAANGANGAGLGTNDQLLILSFPTAYQVPLTSGQVYAVEISADTVGQNANDPGLFSWINSTNGGTFQIGLFPDLGHGAGYRTGPASGNTNYYILPRMLWRTFTDPETYAGDVVGGDQKTPAAARTAVMAIYPPAPSIQITHVSRSGNNVTLTWSPSSTVTGTYSVLRTNIVTAPRANWPVIQTGLSATNYTDTTATGAKNFYIIRNP